MASALAEAIFLSPTMGQGGNLPSRLRIICPFAVPDKIFGLALFLDFIDRGTHCALA